MTIDTTYLDADTDKIKLARPAILGMAQWINDRGVVGRVVDSIADLKALDKTKIKHAFVAGYHAAGDGGGGPYWHDPDDTTSAHNGGAVIVADDGGRWKLAATGKISVKQFGAKGDGLADDRLAIEKANEFVAQAGGTLWFPAGDYLVNSYGSDADLASAHGNIFRLYSNTSFVFDEGAKIVVGAFFDDKPFVAFSGYNAATTAGFTEIENVVFSGGVIDFSGATSKMRAGYRLRIGIQFAKCTRAKVIGTKFENGDLTNAIAAGFQTWGDDFEVRGATFRNLVQESAQNTDFTAVYANSTRSRISGCSFLETSTQAKRVAAAVELHKSNSSWTGSDVSGYTRGGFLVSTTTESTFTSDLVVSGNVATVTNAFEYLWTDTGCTLRNVKICDNVVTCAHIPGEPMLYNGAQGLLGAANEASGGGTEAIIVSNNHLLISHTEIAGRATLAWLEKTQQGVHLLENTCVNVKDGIHVSGAATDVIGWVVRGNRFYADAVASNFFSIGGRNVTQSHFEDNEFDFGGAAYDSPITLSNSGTISSSSVSGVRIKRDKPSTRDITFPSAFAADTSNRASYVLYGKSLVYPSIAAGAAGVATVSGLASGDIRGGASFLWRGAYTPTEIAIANSVGADTNDNVKLLIFNKSGASYAGATVSGDLSVEL